MKYIDFSEREKQKKKRTMALNHITVTRVGSKEKKLMKIFVIISTVYGHFQITKYIMKRSNKIRFFKIYNLTVNRSHVY